MATKKESAAPKLAAVKQSKPKAESLMRPGKASKRVRTRVVYLYGAPKSGKTTSVSHLVGNAKWIITDSNCIPTLDAMDRLPDEDDTYEVSSLSEAREVVKDMIEAAKLDGLGVDYVIHDSLTATNDLMQQEVARVTGQRFLGDNKQNNGWQQFNTEFGAFIDLLAELGRYVTVIVICHAKEKIEAAKGDFNGLNLPPQMALRAGRTANWILYQTASSTSAEDDDQDTEFSQIVDSPTGKRRIERVIYTRPLNLWVASVNAKNLAAEEPPNLAKMFAKAGL